MFWMHYTSHMYVLFVLYVLAMYAVSFPRILNICVFYDHFVAWFLVGAW